MPRKPSLLLSILIIFLVCSPFITPQHRAKEIISIPSIKKFNEILFKMGLDFLMEWKGRLYFLATLDEVAEIDEKGIPYALETPDFYQSCYASPKRGINGDYHSYKELETDLLALEASSPHLAKVLILGRSLEERNIYALKVSAPFPLGGDKAKVLFIGCHHAREWISVEIPFLLGKYLIENFDSNPRVKEILEKSEVWIVPLLNPDGLEYSIYFYRFWRKNRRDNGNGSFGVDLNRNYQYAWGFDDQGSSPDHFSETYRGISPFSEPETQAVQNLFLEHKFQAMISYHSYSQTILYPWGYNETPCPSEALLAQLAKEMSELLFSVNGTHYTYGQGAKLLYLTNGDATDWSYGTFGIPSFTIELPPLDILHGGFFNAEEDIKPIFEENLPAMLYLIEWAIQDFESQKYFELKKNERFLSPPPLPRREGW